MKVLISGTPGTGKTTIAEKLAVALKKRKVQIDLLDLKDFIIKNKLSKRGTVPIAALSKKLNFYLRKQNLNNYIIENHLLCEFKIPSDFIFVLRTDPLILKKRLKKRKYSENKIKENVEAEILDYCAQRILKIYKKEPIEIDSSKSSTSQIVKRLINIIYKKLKKGDDVDFSKYLMANGGASKGRVSKELGFAKTK